MIWPTISSVLFSCQAMLGIVACAADWFLVTLARPRLFGFRSAVDDVSVVIERSSACRGSICLHDVGGMTSLTLSFKSNCSYYIVCKETWYKYGPLVN